jgi:uncharacterized surface protein with fasciclin (FAS1) repeats
MLLMALAVLSSTTSARHVLQAPAATMNAPVLESGPAATPAPPAAADATSSNTTFPTLEAALKAANLTTLAAAVHAAGLAPNATESVTILAPTNKAFEKRLLEDLQMTPQQLLQNQTVLVEVGALAGRDWHFVANVAQHGTDMYMPDQQQTASCSNCRAAVSSSAATRMSTGYSSCCTPHACTAQPTHV